MEIINFLTQNRPLQANQAYNIYRDLHKTKAINYLQLSDNVENLQIDNQPGVWDHNTLNFQLWFAQENEMKWD